MTAHTPLNLSQAREHVGDGVIYRPHPGACPEDGDITRVSDRLVFVLYVGDRAPKATRPDDLHLLHPCPDCAVGDHP